jgi:hypothetical protein
MRRISGRPTLFDPEDRVFGSDVGLSLIEIATSIEQPDIVHPLLPVLGAIGGDGDPFEQLRIGNRQLGLSKPRQDRAQEAGKQHGAQGDPDRAQCATRSLLTLGDADQKRNRILAVAARADAPSAACRKWK